MVGIHVVKGVGSRIATDKLKDASAQLLLARIRGEEPQLSYTFVQRLLDEVILIREVEDAKAPILEVSDEGDWAADSGIFDVPELLPSDLDDSAFELSDDPDTDDESELAVDPPRPPRRRVLATSRRERWTDSINILRVLFIALMAVFVLTCAVFLSGCGPRTRNYVYINEPLSDTDRVGPLLLRYRDAAGEPIHVNASRRSRIAFAVSTVLDQFKLDHGPLTRMWVCDIYLGGIPSANPSWVSCGVPNAGVCYSVVAQRLWVAGGRCDSMATLYHALVHAWLQQQDGQQSEDEHRDAHWAEVRKRVAELEAQICAYFARLDALTSR